MSFLIHICMSIAGGSQRSKNFTANSCFTVTAFLLWTTKNLSLTLLIARHEILMSAYG